MRVCRRVLYRIQCVSTGSKIPVKICAKCIQYANKTQENMKRLLKIIRNSGIGNNTLLGEKKNKILSQVYRPFEQ